MKIIATPLPSGSPVTLGDDSVFNWVTDLPMPSAKGQPQVEELFRSATPFVAWRANVSAGFSWSVTWQLSTLAAAAAFIWAHAATVPRYCSLAIYDDAGGTTTFSSALIAAVDVISVSGLSVQVRYNVTGATP